MEHVLKLLKKAAPLLAKDKNPESWQLSKEIKDFFLDYEYGRPVWYPTKTFGWLRAERYGVGLMVIPPEEGKGLYLWAARYNNSMVEGKALSEEDAKEQAVEAAKGMFEGRR
jgi:hypothetical protein